MPTTITHPETKRVDVVEQHFGQTIADPFRWLENDVRNDRSVTAMPVKVVNLEEREICSALARTVVQWANV